MLRSLVHTDSNRFSHSLFLIFYFLLPTFYLRTDKFTALTVSVTTTAIAHHEDKLKKMNIKDQVDRILEQGQE